MSQYLSLSTFALEIGSSQSVVEELITDGRIKVYQFGTGEPFIPRGAVALAKRMIPQGRPLTDNEESIIQAAMDQVNRAKSRARIATERREQEHKVEKRRLSLSKGRNIP